MTAANDLDQLIRKTFPMPSDDNLIKQMRENCPFAFFGITGGFGETRRSLLKTLSAVYDAGIEPKQTIAGPFYKLIREGIDDFLLEQLHDGTDSDSMLTPERAVLELRDYVNDKLYV